MKLLHLTWILSLATRIASAGVSWEQDVVPILQANCLTCHQPEKAKGGLDLSTHDALLQGGSDGPVIIPGNALASLLIQSVSGDKPEMPPKGESLSSAEITILRQWINEGARNDGKAGTPGRNFNPPTYSALPSLHAMALSPDGSWLAVAGRHEILLHRADGSGIEARLPGDSPRLESLVFSRDGSLLAACGGAPSEYGEIQVWDVATRTRIRTVRIGSDSLFGISISPDHRLVAVGGSDKLVRAISLEDGREMMRCDNHLDWVFGTSFTNDGLRLATVSRDKVAKLIDVTTGQLIDDINRPRDPLLCLARHPLDDLVATGGNEGRVRFFKMEPRGGRLSEGDNRELSFIREYEHMGSPIHAIAFSPDGSLLACAAQSGEIRIFQTETAHRHSLIKPEHGTIFTLAFTADGRHVVAGGMDGRVRFHPIEKSSQPLEFDSVPLAEPN